MNLENFPIMAGTISSLIFMSGTMSMLGKTWHTKDVSSYSMSAMWLNNFGNLVHWVYVLSLPLGPIYLLHGFYTIATILMLVWCLVYRHHPATAKRITQSIKRVTQTMPTIAVAKPPVSEHATSLKNR